MTLTDSISFCVRAPSNKRHGIMCNKTEFISFQNRFPQRVSSSNFPFLFWSRLITCMYLPTCKAVRRMSLHLLSRHSYIRFFSILRHHQLLKTKKSQPEVDLHRKIDCLLPYYQVLSFSIKSYKSTDHQEALSQLHVPIDSPRDKDRPCRIGISSVS